MLCRLLLTCHRCLRRMPARCLRRMSARSCGGCPRKPAEDVPALEHVAPVRRLMRAINALAGGRRDLSPQQVFNELETLRTVAEELPVPAGVGITDTALAELAAWQTGFDNGAFVGAILYLLQGIPVDEVEIA